ncbi:MAG: hypothetical protein K2Q01_03840 [Rickettsiales bacterium]|nr:hypothetical protein [Rickettsiales bacterium]
MTAAIANTYTAAFPTSTASTPKQKGEGGFQQFLTPADASQPATAQTQESLISGPFPGPTTDIFGRKWGSGAISIDEIVQIGQEKAEKAKTSLDNLFSRYGIASFPPVNISYNTQGEMQLGTHPDKEKIEKALNENPAVKDEIGQALAMQSFGAELQHYEIYMQRYDAAYKTGGQKAINALTDRYLSLPKPTFSYDYGLGGLTLQTGQGTVQSWLAATARALA